MTTLDVKDGKLIIAGRSFLQGAPGDSGECQSGSGGCTSAVKRNLHTSPDRRKHDAAGELLPAE